MKNDHTGAQGNSLPVSGVSEPAFIGKCDIYGDLHDRAPDEHAYETHQCTWRDLFQPKEGKEPPGDVLEDVDAYLEPFAAPILIDGKNMCPHCGHPFNGGLLDSLLGDGGFEWGLAHGEGRCRCCKWPARLYHFVKDRHGEELMTFRHLVLAYRPAEAAVADTTDPITQSERTNLDPRKHVHRPSRPGLPRRFRSLRSSD